MPRSVRVLLTGFAFLCFVIGGAVQGWFLLPFSRAGHRSPRAQRRRAHQVLFRGYRVFARILGLLRLADLRLPEAVELPSGAYVLVANHPTLMDVMLLLATFPGVVCLVKASWFRSPFIAPLLRQAGYLPGPSGEEEGDGAPVLERIVGALRDGFPVLVFPEGSRSPAGGLRRFRVGAFLAAQRAGVPVVPVMIHTWPPTLLKGQAWYEVPDRSVTYEVRVLPARRVEGDARDHARALRATFAEALGLEEPTPDDAVAHDPRAEGRHGAIP